MDYNNEIYSRKYISYFDESLNKVLEEYCSEKVTLDFLNKIETYNILLSDDEIEDMGMDIESEIQKSSSNKMRLNLKIVKLKCQENHQKKDGKQKKNNVIKFKDNNNRILN
ncbi:MAG TPA: hypothetical protein VJH65_03130 [Candidatus Nanoarchaeia archaeon]|nr:hypothetical protein [Candidatus Nanoarchaeia archaeon]